VSTFITRLDEGTRDGPRLAVKDLIDVEGVPTTCGSKAVADDATPAGRDAACVASARAAGARLVGKVNLHELAFGATGVNPWFGTPVNPIAPDRPPGGSSSGSAVAVATGEADVAFGTDTGGSVRIPSACCGTAGLKTTWGRVDVDGVWPLAPTLDTVGPMARDVNGLVTGMSMLEPGFAVDPIAPVTVGRVRGLDVDPVIDAAIDRALREAGFDVVDVELPGWNAANGAGGAILVREGHDHDGHLDRSKIGADVNALIDIGAAVDDDALAAAGRVQGAWQAELGKLFERVEALALPVLRGFPPTLDHADDLQALILTLPINLAGVPALALPVPADAPLPASLQLVGPPNSEERLLAAGLMVEGAISR
jgi:amidase